jgi:AcrR family transcriptional regulator
MQAINTELQKGQRSTQRERLVAGMIAAANRDGYAGAKVSAVIAEAGVSRPTFYEYFADKDDCFLAVMAEIHEEVLADIRLAVEARPPQEATRAVVDALVVFASSQPALARFAMNEAMAGGARTLDARDAAIAAIGKLIDETHEQVQPETATPDVSSAMLVGGVYRLLASRLRRGVPGISGLREDLGQWVASYEQPAGEHRWRTTKPAAKRRTGPSADGAIPAADGAIRAMRAPMPLGPGRPRLTEEEVAENHRQRILFAVGHVAERKGYADATIAEITKFAGVDRRSFYALFKDKQDAFMAAHEFGFQQLLAVTAGAFFTGGSWPERIREGTRAFTRFLEASPVIAHVGFVEAYAVGPGAVQRVEDSHVAFTIFLQEGYQYRPDHEAPSRLALEAIVTTFFEFVYHDTRASETPTTSQLAPALAYLCLAPFLGPVEANRFIDGALDGARR